MTEANPPYRKNEIKNIYICKFCDDIYKDVQQTDCGCRYCLECLEKQIHEGKCSQCGEILPNFKQPDKAFKKEINNMNINCFYCNWNGKFIDYKVHFKTHEKIICEYCKTNFTNEENLKKHLDEYFGNCEKQPFQCYYSKIGCNKNDSYIRDELKKHISDDTSNHINLVYNNLDNRVKVIENYYQNVSQSVDQSSISTSEEISNKEKFKHEPVDSINKKAKSSMEDPNDKDISKIDMLNYSFKCVGEDLNKYVHFTEKLSKELEDCKTNEKKLKDDVENLQKSLTFAQATIINLEERILSLEKASYNGTLVWKITNVRDKIQEAKSGRQTSIYSPPFYTHQNGFKMCGRVYLFGDGMGRNTHVSLFFVIMRGEYDALLRWPFRQKVTFILLDQSTNESRENIIDAFRPDPNSNSFKRPISDMNIASGIPLFCPLAKLNSNEHEYIKDDCMFIKIIVDSRDLIDI